MTRDDIIRMARESGMSLGHSFGSLARLTALSNLERFAALVAAAEREACADFLEHGFIDDDDHHLLYAREIRARGDA